MKNRVSHLSLCLIFSLFVFNGTAQTEPETPCQEWWNTVDLSGLCTMTNIHFDVEEQILAVCNIKSNSSFPHDDLIYVTIYYAYSQASAMEEYQAEKEGYEGMSGYSEVSGLGDAGYSYIQMENGFLDSAIIDAVKSGYNIHIEVNGNAANGSNNCLDQNSFIEFAKAIVNNLDE